MKLIISWIAIVLLSLSLNPSFGEITSVRDPSDLTKWTCDLLTFDQKSGSLESQQLVKKWLDACIERGLLTTEERELGALPHRGVSSVELEHVYSYSNFDLKKTIQLINDPTYPKNVYNFVLMGYDGLNNRTVVEPEFKKLLQTEIVGFGIDEPNNRIFVQVDSKYANQENYDRYEKIFRETIGPDVPIKFDVVERPVMTQLNRDFIIPIILAIIASIIGLVIYFKKRK